MGDTATNPAQVPARDTDFQGVGFAEQLRNSLRLTGEPIDRILVEVGAEVDRLEECVQSPGMKPTNKAQTSSRRIDGLKALYQLLKDREEKAAKTEIASVVASFIVVLKETFKETGVAPEVEETILMSLVLKVEEAEKKRLEMLKQQKKNKGT